MLKPVAYLILLTLSLNFLISGCSIKAVNQPGDGNQDSIAVFKDVSSSTLPVNQLMGTSKAAKAVDIDNDGDLDLIVAIKSNPNKILINDGTGFFTDESNSRLPAKNFDSEDLAVADFNQDGSPDLFFVNNVQKINEYYLNNGDGTFTDASNRIPVTGNSYTVITADINNDNAPDLIIGNDGPNVILINNGQGSFSNQTDTRLPQLNNITRDLSLADIDNDGDLDLIVANEDDNRIQINTGNGFFVDRTQARLPLLGAIEETRDVDLADVDNDGDLDLYFGNVVIFQSGKSAQDRLLTNQEGSFTDMTKTKLPVINTNTVDADFFDIDRDGDFDILTGDFDSSGDASGNYSGANFAKVFINDGSGFYNDQTAKFFPNNFSPNVDDFEIADYNGDGLFDIYVANDQSPDVLLLQQGQ